MYIYDIQSDLMHKSHQNIQILEIADKAILRCFFYTKTKFLAKRSIFA